MLAMVEGGGLTKTASSKQPIRAVWMLAHGQIIWVDVPSLAQGVGVSRGGSAASVGRRALRPPTPVRGRCSHASSPQVRDELDQPDIVE